ncbi:MAG: hypothetical protein OEZ32_01505 [Nitrospinota bacterium]|nr:hypothetical protein [Nitrospinota bacterium]
MTKDDLLDAIRKLSKELGRRPTRAEFKTHFDIAEHYILKHYKNWTEAVRASGLQPDESYIKTDEEILLKDWAEVVRKLNKIPTMAEYKHGGSNYSVAVFKKRFGPWTGIPIKFRECFHDNPEYDDVFTLIERSTAQAKVLDANSDSNSIQNEESTKPVSKTFHIKRDQRPTYGNPLSFRGLQHEPLMNKALFFFLEWWLANWAMLSKMCRQDFPIVKPNARLVMEDGKKP